jgi:hypothetical protein
MYTDIESSEESYPRQKKYTVLLSKYLGTSSHMLGCAFVPEFISAKQMTQQQYRNHFFLQQQ